MIGWFILINKLGDSWLKYWYIIEYTELNYRKKINHIKLTLYDKILHLLLAIDWTRVIDIIHFDLPMGEANWDKHFGILGGHC